MEKKKSLIFFITLIFVLCCFMAVGSWAAKKTDFYKSNAKDYIRSLNDNGKNMGKAFGLSKDEGFVMISQNTDLNRETHSRYQQTFKGFPVWGIRTVLSTKADRVIKLHGAFIEGAPRDVGNIPKKLDALKALNEMKDNHKAQDEGAVWNFRNETYGTYVYFHKKSQKARLCYVVSFFADTDCGNPSRPVFFIDAKNGKIVDSFDSLAYAYDGTGPGGNQKIGQYTYGTTYPKFGVSINGSTCTMNYADCKTVDLNHGTSGTTPYSYTCYNNTHESINGGYCPLNDGQFFGQTIYNMYDDWYGVPVLTFQLMMRVHYSNNYENAFWDGSSMTFGDGYTTFYPLVCLDVSAHEVSHGFTEQNSNLTYSGQSGGINEAFSDMAGEAAKYYMRGTNDFMVGYDIFKSPSGALRYMYNPPLDGHSIDNVADYYSGMDVHYSSGIFNKAFYLIATYPGFTTRMAFDIFVKANQDYWVASTNFVQGAEGAQDAAADLGYNCAAVRDAFADVGITLVCAGPPVANFSGAPTSGAVPLTVNFTDLSTNSPTSWSWNFGDSGTSTLKNPSHTYNSAGTYTVSLTAANASGSDNETKTNYITVTAPQPPVANFTASTTNPSVGGSVTFTDTSTNTPTSWSWTFEGGTPGTSTAQNPTITYNTVGTYDVTLVATNAQGSDTETKVDYITVSSVPYCTSSGNSQAYEYISRVVVADLNNLSGASPYTDFTYLVAHVTQGNSVSVSLTPGFVSSSYTEWWRIWVDYNGDHDFADTGEQVFSGSGSSVVSGSFTVPTSSLIGATRMRVSMSYSTYAPYCGTFTYGEVEDYTLQISGTTPQPPVANFTANDTSIEVGQSVSFTDQSTNNPTSWAWTFEGGTPSGSSAQNPTITYNTAGTFDVTLVATNSAGSDSELKVDYISVTSTPVTYCTSSGNSQGYEYIRIVRVGTINNTSGASPYSDFTSISTNAAKGGSVSVTLTPGFTGSSYTEYWRIWVDYNKDGDFADTGEQVFGKYGSSNVTGSFTVPTSAVTGSTRMRVSMRYGGYPSSCGTFTYGEVEDYTVNIQ